MFPKDRADPKKINPQHYHASGLQAVDVMEAFFKDDLHMAQAFKYMARAGKKETSPYEEDVEKAIWWLKRSLDFRTGD